MPTQVEAVRAGEPDEWTWEDIEKALLNKGFECAPVIGGVVWDEPMLKPK